MAGLPLSITLVLVLLTVFLMFITGLKYAIKDRFTRTRLMMTSFFLFIVATLTISFWQYTMDTLPFTIPAALLGMAAGYFIGVRADQQKLRMEGLRHYTKHFAHIHWSDIEQLNWWALVNFYSVMGGLILINFVGLSTVIFRGTELWAIISSVFGAFLLGTILPYLTHLWSIRSIDTATSTTSEA